MEPSKPSRYRPDIDGLRAIAVLSVIAYHLHFSPMSGGYVGVDVFFVISGYLITGIVMRDIQLSRFSLAGFYERRCRRILPALFLITLVTTVLSYIYLLPGEFEDYAKSLIASVFSASNFYFASKAGYFSASGPLLHTWSLAVEEQFYIVFPLMLMLIYRFKRDWLKASVLLVAAISLAMSIVASYRFPIANFYMPFTRAWELMVGAILALGIVPSVRTRVGREACSLVGVVMVLVAIFRYDEATRFPGLSALLPCVGAGLLLFAGESGESLVGRLLSLRPATFIGAISYSLYLWHWPLAVFGQRGFLTINRLSHRTNVLLYLAECIVLATLSWRFVERPFRFGSLKMPRQRLFAYSAATIAFFAVVGLSIVQLHGLSYRYPPAALDVAKSLDDKANYQYFRQGTCFVVYPEPYSEFKPATCLAKEPGKKNYLLLGDSHAASLWHALDTQLAGANVMEATASNCKPFPRQSGSTDCSKLMDYVYDQYLADNKIDGLLLAARWKDRDLPRLGALATWAKSKDIPLTVIGPTAEYDSPLPILLAYSIRANDPTLPYRHRVVQIEGLDKRMQGLAQNNWHIPYVSLVNAVCTGTHCEEYADQARTIPILFDHDHFTDAGSRFVVDRLVANGELGSGNVAVDTTNQIR